MKREELDISDSSQKVEKVAGTIILLQLLVYEIATLL